MGGGWSTCLCTPACARAWRSCGRSTHRPVRIALFPLRVVCISSDSVRPSYHRRVNEHLPSALETPASRHPAVSHPGRMRLVNFRKASCHAPAGCSRSGLPGNPYDFLQSAPNHSTQSPGTVATPPSLAGTLYLLSPTPVERLINVRCLAVGALELPMALLLPTAYTRPSPYLTPHALRSAGSTSMHSRNNIVRGQAA